MGLVSGQGSQNGTVAQLVAALRNLVPAITTFFMGVLLWTRQGGTYNRLALRNTSPVYRRVQICHT